MGLCASTNAQQPSSPDSVMKDRSKRLDIGGGTQNLNPLVARTSVANQEQFKSGDSDEKSSSSSDDDEEIVDDWLENGPTIEEMQIEEDIQRKISSNKLKENKEKRDRSKWSKFFEQFPREHQTELYNALTYETFYDGDKIVEQGKDGDTFYDYQWQSGNISDR